MHFRSTLNNSINTFIDKFLNEIVYKKKLNKDFNINEFKYEELDRFNEYTYQK